MGHRKVPAPVPAGLKEDAPNTPGTVGAGHRFGETLGALSGDREDVLLVSSRYPSTGSVYVASNRALSDGAGNNVEVSRGWVPGQGGIPATGARRFGWSVSN